MKGMKCELCGTDNGITMYIGKVCKRCGKVLTFKINKDLKEKVKKVVEE
jgi:hypothetical protein